MDTAATVWALLAVVAVGSAAFLTHRFSPKDGGARRLFKFAGILVSTMPIVGLIQGAIGARLEAQGYSSACFLQAAVGAAVYSVGTYVLKVLA